jgi:fatty-acyl-CoA synthase
MQEAQLTLSSLLEHSRRVYATSRVLTFEGDGVREATYAEVGSRAHRLASALQSLGVEQGDRVGTFLWNTQEHLEAYLAVPSMGAVLHTINLRLFPEQLAYVINHGGDKVVIVDATVLPLLLKVSDQLTTVEQYVLIGDADASALGKPVHSYEALLATSSDSFDWPELDERTAAAMCYTSGTTGNPKGVVYSHRSTYLHSLASGGGNTFALSEHDRILPVVPMFHANAWGLPYSGWAAGSDFVMPGRFLQAEPIAKMIETYRPTIAGAVPTIWNDLLTYVDEHPTDLSSLRLVPCGGSAVPLSLMKAFQERHGVRIIQAWGMTETSPLAAVSHESKGSRDEWLDRSGPDGSPPASSCDWSGRPVTSCPGTVWPSARCRSADPGSPAATTSTPTPTSSTTAGCAPATWQRSVPTDSSRSPIAPRTSSSPAASGSRRSSSRTP